MTRKQTLKKQIGKRVTTIRKDIMHMSKCEFADMIGMKNQYLGTVETGERGLTVEKVIEICNKTGVTADYLLFGITNVIEKDAKKLLTKYSEDDIDQAFKVIKDLSSILK